MVNEITFNNKIIDLCAQFINHDLREDFFKLNIKLTRVTS